MREIVTFTFMRRFSARSTGTVARINSCSCKNASLFKWICEMDLDLSKGINFEDRRDDRLRPR